MQGGFVIDIRVAKKFILINHGYADQLGPVSPTNIKIPNSTFHAIAVRVRAANFLSITNLHLWPSWNGLLNYLLTMWF